MASSWKARAWAIITFFLSYVCSLLSCPCDTTGILAFSLSLDGIGENATVKCCAQDGYYAGVYLLRENMAREEEVNSYFKRGSCDGLVFSVRNIQCSWSIMCHSAKTDGNENHVTIGVGSLISCTDPPFNADIDALEHCPCM